MDTGKIINNKKCTRIEIVNQRWYKVESVSRLLFITILGLFHGASVDVYQRVEDLS